MIQSTQQLEPMERFPTKFILIRSLKGSTEWVFPAVTDDWSEADVKARVRQFCLLQFGSQWSIAFCGASARPDYRASLTYRDADGTAKLGGHTVTVWFYCNPVVT